MIKLTEIFEISNKILPKRAVASDDENREPIFAYNAVCTDSLAIAKIVNELLSSFAAFGSIVKIAFNATISICVKRRRRIGFIT